MDLDYWVLDAGSCEWRFGFSPEEMDVSAGMTASDSDTWHDAIAAHVELASDPDSEFGVLLALPPDASLAVRSRAAAALFSAASVSAILLSPAPVVALCNSAFDTGVLVSVGESWTHVLAIYEGHAVVDGIVAHPLGGAHLRAAASPDPAADKVGIADQSCDGLLVPALIGLDGAATPGLHAVIGRVVALADVSLRGALLSHVVLIGGGSQLGDFPERLERELRNAATRAPWTPRVVANGDRRLASWLGGTLFVNMPSGQHQFATRTQYETDPACVHAPWPAHLPCRSLEEVEREHAAERRAADAEHAASVDRSRRAAAAAAEAARVWWMSEAPSGSAAERARQITTQGRLVMPLFEWALRGPSLLGCDDDDEGGGGEAVAASPGMASPRSPPARPPFLRPRRLGSASLLIEGGTNRSFGEIGSPATPASTTSTATSAAAAAAVGASSSSAATAAALAIAAKSLRMMQASPPARPPARFDEAHDDHGHPKPAAAAGSAGSAGSSGRAGRGTGDTGRGAAAHGDEVLCRRMRHLLLAGWASSPMNVGSSVVSVAAIEDHRRRRELRATWRGMRGYVAFQHRGTQRVGRSLAAWRRASLLTAMGRLASWAQEARLLSDGVVRALGARMGRALEARWDVWTRRATERREASALLSKVVRYLSRTRALGTWMRWLAARRRTLLRHRQIVSKRSLVALSRSVAIWVPRAKRAHRRNLIVTAIGMRVTTRLRECQWRLFFRWKSTSHSMRERWLVHRAVRTMRFQKWLRRRHCALSFSRWLELRARRAAVAAGVARRLLGAASRWAASAVRARSHAIVTAGLQQMVLRYRPRQQLTACRRALVRFQQHWLAFRMREKVLKMASRVVVVRGWQQALAAFTMWLAEAYTRQSIRHCLSAGSSFLRASRQRRLQTEALSLWDSRARTLTRLSAKARLLPMRRGRLLQAAVADWAALSRRRSGARRWMQRQLLYMGELQQQIDATDDTHRTEMVGRFLSIGVEPQSLRKSYLEAGAKRRDAILEEAFKRTTASKDAWHPRNLRLLSPGIDSYLEDALEPKKRRTPRPSSM